METYVERIKTNAEHLAKDVFPQKALELDEIINVTRNNIFSSGKKRKQTQKSI